MTPSQVGVGFLPIAASMRRIVIWFFLLSATGCGSPTHKVQNDWLNEPQKESGAGRATRFERSLEATRRAQAVTVQEQLRREGGYPPKPTKEMVEALVRDELVPSLNDPSSFSLVSIEYEEPLQVTEDWEDPNTRIALGHAMRVTYRAKNTMGGLVLTRVWANFLRGKKPYFTER